jgi:hypothetical protein
VNESEEDRRSDKSETVLREKGGGARGRKQRKRKSEDLERMPDTVISIQLHCLFKPSLPPDLEIQLSD